MTEPVMAAAVAAADLNHKDTPHVLQPSDDLSLNTDAINQCMSDPTGYSVDDIPALLMPHIQPDPNNVTVKAGAFVSIGGRRYQEDRVVIIHDLNAFCAPNERESMSHTRRSFFAVFDGHGGPRCSEYLANHFHKLVATHPKLKIDPLLALQQAWIKIENEVLSHFQYVASTDPRTRFPRDGSTATVCLIVENECFITNCGDSAACVEYSDGSVQKVTEDHGTLNPSEIERCVQAGARFMPQTAPAMCACLPGFAKRIEVGKPRLYPGGLLVTRAMGDFFAKLPIYGGVEKALISDHGRVECLQLRGPVRRGLISLNMNSLMNTTCNSPCLESHERIIYEIPCDGYTPPVSGISGISGGGVGSGNGSLNDSGCSTPCKSITKINQILPTPNQKIIDNSTVNSTVNSVSSMAGDYSAVGIGRGYPGSSGCFTRYIPVGPEEDRDGSSVTVRRIILASDGVWDSKSKEEIVQHMEAVKDSPAIRVLPMPPNDTVTGMPPFITLGSAGEEDSDIKQLARSVCRLAVTGDYWMNAGCSPDNTSCIVIEITQPQGPMQLPDANPIAMRSVSTCSFSLTRRKSHQQQPLQPSGLTRLHE